MSQPLYINGRFLGKSLTGTERFAREIVWALDAHLQTSNDAAEVTLLAPQGTPAPEGLKKIGFRTCGTHQGHLWEQWDLFLAAQRGKLLSLTNSGPILHPDQTVVIHDALVYRMPQDYNAGYHIFHRLLGIGLAKRGAQIATVSAFSQKELADVLGVKSESITIIHNGHEHILRHAPDESVLQKLSVKPQEYLLFVGSPVPRKNLSRAVEAFQALNRPDLSFVIVGAANAKVFKGEEQETPPNIIKAGHLSDEEIVALYKNAIALVFPSLYEGFGIPPLEAMVHGCPVIAAAIPPIQEVCADAVLYIDPLSVQDMTNQMAHLLATPALRSDLARKGQTRYPLFSWGEGGKRLYSFLCEAI